MQFLILAAGKPSLGYAKEGVELWTTKKLVDLAKDWQMHSVRRIAFLIGASDGHTEELRSRCNHILSLSKFTLQHELALVVLLEQLYRCHTILAGTPYHR